VANKLLVSDKLVTKDRPSIKKKKERITSTETNRINSTFKQMVVTFIEQIALTVVFLIALQTYKSQLRFQALFHNDK
jgi:hypothetical protein